MTRANKKARGASTAATLDLEKEVARSKRDLKDIDRIIERAKSEEKSRRGEGLVGRVPSMFLDIPETIIGGAETYFQEILSSTSKSFARAFGEVKGARQLQIEAYRQFEGKLDSESQEEMDYITIASHIVVLIAYHVIGAAEEKGFNLADQKNLTKKAVQIFRSTFMSPDKKITDALKAVTDLVIGGGGAVSVSTPGIYGSGPLSTILGLNAGSLVYPLNLNWIKTKEKMIEKKFLAAKDKAAFLLKPEVLLAYRKYASQHEPKESVALPTQVSSKSTAAELVKFFQESPTYSLEDTFVFYRAAYNATSNVRKAGQKDALDAKLKIVAKAFDKFVDEIKDSFFYESANEAVAFKKEYLNILGDGPTAEDFASASYLVEQAKNVVVLDASTLAAPTIDTASGLVTFTPTNYIANMSTLGQEVFSDLDLVELLGKAKADVSDVDMGVWAAFQKIEALDHDLMMSFLGGEKAQEIEGQLKDAFEALVTAEYGKDAAGKVTSDFRSRVNDLFKKTVTQIATDFNDTFEPEITSHATSKFGTLRTSCVKALNEVVNNYLATDDQDELFATDGVNGKIKVVDIHAKLSGDSVLILADGDSLDIYNSTTDEFGNEAVDIALETIRLTCLKEGISNAVFVDIENFIVDSATVLQVVLDSIYQEALRDPDIAIFNNPAYSTAALVGVGAGALVGTHALTALSQRLLNAEGKTEGAAFYAAESIVPVAVAGAGLYLHMNPQEHSQLGVPLMAGAVGSVLLRVLTRKFIENSALKYVGAGPAIMLGDKTFGADWESIKNAGSTAPSTDSDKKGYIPFLGNDGFFDEEGVANQEEYEGLGRYEQVPMHDPFWSYNPPTEISYNQANRMMEQRGAMYAAPAGLDGGLGRYEQVPMHDPFWSYNPPTEISYNQANRMMEQRGAMYAAPAGLDGYGEVDEEVLEILDNAQPLTSQELLDEGFSGYVDETVIQLTPASASKVQNAGAGKIIGNSRRTPNTMLIHVGDSEIGVTGMEGGIVQQYNPSLPSGDFGADMIEPPPANSINTSGLFSRGSFSSRLPTIRENFDY